MRPIAMTSLCTIFGFLPLAVGAGEGAEVRAPMAIAVIGGLVVSTLLTLFVIPVMYDRLDRRPDAHYRERALREKIDGVNEREKFRLRLYQSGDVNLEKKVKRGGLGGRGSDFDKD